MHAVRDIVNSPPHPNDQYAGPHEPPLLSIVQEVFMADTNALHALEEAHLDVMYGFLPGDALKSFRRAVSPFATSAKDAFGFLRSTTTLLLTNGTIKTRGAD